MPAEPSPGNASARVSLFLLDSDTLGWPAPPRWADDVFDRQTTNQEFLRAGLRGAYLHDPRVWQVYSPSQATGVQLVRRPGATPLWEAGGPLRVFLHWVYAGTASRLCHAATLGVGGRGVLLVGAGGSGKSGTTLAGISCGMETVGDDYCLVKQARTVTAHPLYRIFKQDATGIGRAFPNGTDKNFGVLNWQGKYEIHESLLSPSPFVTTIDVVGIVVIRVAHLPRCTVRLLTAGPAMRAFAPSSTFQLPDGEHEGIAFVAELCRRLPCVELQLSADAQDIVATIRRLLEDDLACMTS
jgi:hypothetical protein